MIESLTHNGVLFQEPFTSKGFNNIRGENISLLAEEMLWKFTPLYMNPKFTDDDVFVCNAWTDIRSVLPINLQDMNFPNDFNDIFLAMNKARMNGSSSNTMSDEEKKARKEKYGYCMRNGVRTELSNFVCEGSRFFISRGNLRGRWVSSPKAEDVEINASEDVPCTMESHCWKKVELRQTDYVATYKINVGFGKAFIDKFIWISPNSKDKQNDNEHKYEKARKLLLKMDELEKKVLRDVSSKGKLRRENALIAYIVMTYGIRIGNDLGEDNFRDKKVRGASTLCVENMMLGENNTVRLEFVGKDSVLYSETMTVEPSVYEALEMQIRGKRGCDRLYEYATSSTVNEYLKSIYGGEISPKLFRTAKSSALLAKEIQRRKWNNLTDKEFKAQLMECCLATSLLLNHHKTVSEEQKKKTEKSFESKVVSAKTSFEKVRKSADKKIAELEKRRVEFKSCLEGRVLERQLEEIDLEEKEIKKKVSAEKRKYKDIMREAEFRLNSIDVNLGTALNAYSTPKIPMSLCKYADKNFSVIYSKAQLKKFEWAMKVDKNYWKKYPNI